MKIKNNNSKRINNSSEKSLPKKRSKFQDWVTETVSCFNGCSNDCIYCFAKGLAVNRNQMKLYEWKEEKVRPHDVNKKHKLYDKTVMFPGTHDITTDNFDACFTVLKKLLSAKNRVLIVSKSQLKLIINICEDLKEYKKNVLNLKKLLAAKNRVLIVSKPRLHLIAKICDDLKEYKKNMLFRFTIGSMNNEILSFWEPNAPLYEERKQSLEYAFNAGYRTSVSVEPMLDFEHMEELVNDLSPYVNHSIWIGTMNSTWYMDTDESTAKTEAGKLRARRNTAYYGGAKARKIREEIEKIEQGQSKENLKKIYGKLKDHPLIKWKWHIKEAVGLPQPDKPEEWPDD